MALPRIDAFDLHSAIALMVNGTNGIPNIYNRPTFMNPTNNAEKIKDKAAAPKLFRVGISTVITANAVITPSRISPVVAFIGT